MDAKGTQSISFVNIANRYHVLASDRYIALVLTAKSFNVIVAQSRTTYLTLPWAAGKGRSPCPVRAPWTFPSRPFQTTSAIQKLFSKQSLSPSFLPKREKCIGSSTETTSLLPRGMSQMSDEDLFSFFLFLFWGMEV